MSFMFSRRVPLHDFPLNDHKIPSQWQVNALVVTVTPYRRQSHTLTNKLISNIEGIAMCRVIVEWELTTSALKLLPHIWPFNAYEHMQRYQLQFLSFWLLQMMCQSVLIFSALPFLQHNSTLRLTWLRYQTSCFFECTAFPNLSFLLLLDFDGMKL